MRGGAKALIKLQQTSKMVSSAAIVGIAARLSVSDV